MDIKGFLKSKNIQAACIAAGVSLMMSVLGILINYHLVDSANKFAKEANEISNKSYKLSEEISIVQQTPRLSAQISGSSYVGPMQNRIDEVVTIPIVVFNNSDAFAYDIVLDLLISDGTGREVSLNEYFASINVPPMGKKRLVPREQWFMLPPKAISAPVNSKELYSTDKLKFKAKLQLTWKDIKGQQYKFVDLEELRYVKVIDETITEVFLFEPIKAFDVINNPKELEENWGLKFNY